MDKQRILNVSIASVAVLNGLALAIVWLTIKLFGWMIPSFVPLFGEMIILAIFAGGIAFGVRRLVRRVIFPRWLGDRPLDRELLPEFQQYRNLVMLTWWSGILLGMFGLIFFLELIREGSGLPFVAAAAMLGQEKALLEYYILKTEP